MIEVAASVMVSRKTRRGSRAGRQSPSENHAWFFARYWMALGGEILILIKSRIVSPAIRRPATGGTKDMLPGMDRLLVVSSSLALGVRGGSWE